MRFLMLLTLLWDVLPGASHGSTRHSTEKSIADTTAVAVRQFRRWGIARGRSASDSDARSRVNETTAMARILLLSDTDSSDAAAIVSVLARHRHTLQVATNLQEVPLSLDGRDLPYDVVIVDLSRNRPSDWQNFDNILRVARVDPPKPMVLCVSSVYRGPSMKLEVERRGGRFAWI